MWQLQVHPASQRLSDICESLVTDSTWIDILTKAFMSKGIERTCHVCFQVRIRVAKTQASRRFPRVKYHGHHAVGHVWVRPADDQGTNESTLSKNFVKNYHHT